VYMKSPTENKKIYENNLKFIHVLNRV
jgi:hypothetical protein